MGYLTEHAWDGYYRSSSGQQTSDGVYIIAGYTGSYYNDVLLIKTNSNGNEEWKKIIEPPPERPDLDGGVGRSVQQTKDGGYIIAGLTKSYGAGDCDVWLIKTDSSGNEEWSKTFGGSNIDWGQSVQQTTDRGYIIGASTYSYGAGSSDVGLIKVNGEGVTPKTFYVPDNYTTIQAAVDNATAGDTIIVRDSTYTENVDVDKRLTIRSENGSASTVVNASDSNDHVFNVSVNYVNISGFTVTGAIGGYTYLAGIYLYYADHCNISNNNASNNRNGVYMYYSSNSMLINNTANMNHYDGIYMRYSNNNTLTNNTMSGNTYNFGVFDSCSLSTLSIDTSNTVDGKPICYWVDQQDKQIPCDAGFVAVVNSTNITVKDLALMNNSEGVLFAYTNNSRIENVSVSNNTYGVYLRSSNNNTLTNNEQQHHLQQLLQQHVQRL